VRSGAAHMPGEPQMHAAAEDQQPGHHGLHDYAGEERSEEREQAQEDQQAANGDGPANGFLLNSHTVSAHLLHLAGTR